MCKNFAHIASHLVNYKSDNDKSLKITLEQGTD